MLDVEHHVKNAGVFPQSSIFHALGAADKHANQIVLHDKTVKNRRYVVHIRAPKSIKTDCHFKTINRSVTPIRRLKVLSALYFITAQAKVTA